MSKKVYNVGPIDTDAMRLGDTMAQAKYNLARMKQSQASKALGAATIKLAESPENGQLTEDLEKEVGRLTEESIVATEAYIDSFEAIVDLIGRTAEVTDGEGNLVKPNDLPASVVDKIMNRMTADVEEMSDPNA